MKLVIDISHNLYESLIKGYELSKLGEREMRKAIQHGTPLPEHHGRLIDADALEQEMIIAEGKAEGGCDYYMEDVIGSAKEYIIDAETIIPATKEGDGE